MNIGISIDPAGTLPRFFESLADGLDLSRPGPMREGMLSASDLLWEEMRRRFGTEGDGQWAPLAESTARQRKRLGYGPYHPILKRTGQLEKSLSRGDANHILDVTSHTVTEGTTEPKARYHQDGNSRMPSREILVGPIASGVAAGTSGPLDDMREAIAEGLRGTMTEAARKAMAGSGAAGRLAPEPSISPAS